VYCELLFWLNKRIPYHLAVFVKNRKYSTGIRNTLKTVDLSFLVVAKSLRTNFLWRKISLKGYFPLPYNKCLNPEFTTQQCTLAK